MNAKMKVLSIALVGLCGFAGSAMAACPAGPTTAEGGAWTSKAVLPPSTSALAIATPGLDAVALVTPNKLHRAQAEAAFAAGLHVFVEKPIAHTLDDGRAMIAAAERAGRVLMVGHNMRYALSAKRARTMLTAGGLGDPVGVELHFSSDNGRRLEPGSWRLRPDEAPLLPVTQLGIHALDLVHALLGPIGTVSAFARTVTTPPGSIRVTIPVPIVEWRTLSPVERLGTSSRGAYSRAGPP